MDYDMKEVRVEEGLHPSEKERRSVRLDGTLEPVMVVTVEGE